MKTKIKHYCDIQHFLGTRNTSIYTIASYWAGKTLQERVCCNGGFVHLCIMMMMNSVLLLIRLVTFNEVEGLFEPVRGAVTGVERNHSEFDPWQQIWVFIYLLQGVQHCLQRLHSVLQLQQASSIHLYFVSVRVMFQNTVMGY